VGKRSKGKNGKRRKSKRKSATQKRTLPLGSPGTLRDLCRTGVSRGDSEEKEVQRISNILGSRLEFVGKERLPGSPLGSYRVYIWKVFRPTPIPFRDSPRVALWHGSGVRNFSNILLRRLEPGSKFCMFGSAIYLGGLSKAKGYCGEEGILLKCEARLGKVYRTPGSLRRCPVGFDTVMGVKGETESWRGHLQHDEWAVYNPKRVSVLEVHVLNKLPTPT
jgi:hypothetical protein